MKKGSVFIVLLICAANFCCVSNKTTNNTADIEIKNIECHYINDEKYLNAFIELIITKDGNGYNYKMTTPKRKLEGKIGTSVNPECFVLKGIKWASWEIDGIPQELPEDISVYIEKDGLLIQNYDGSSIGNSSYLLFNDINEKYIILKNKYVTLPNGTMVDRRICKDTIDKIFKRFEAVENGDIAAFRSTLGEMQDGVDYHYQLLLLFTFFGDLFDIAPDVFDNAIATGENMPEIANKLFNGEPPLKKRNTGLIIKKLEIKPGSGLVVTAMNNKNEELIYNFLYW